MTGEPRQLRSDCPIAASLDLFGDRWTLLLLRDLLLGGPTHFADFARDEQIPPNTLSNRLQRLLDAGLIAKAPDESDARRWTYRPLRPALALLPVLLEMMAWGDEHTGGSAPPEIIEAMRTDRAGLIADLNARHANA